MQIRAHSTDSDPFIDEIRIALVQIWMATPCHTKLWMQILEKDYSYGLAA